MNQHQVTTDVLIDLSKGIDKVDHKILRDKLAKCTVAGSDHI